MFHPSSVTIRDCLNTWLSWSKLMHLLCAILQNFQSPEIWEELELEEARAAEVHDLSFRQSKSKPFASKRYDIVVGTLHWWCLRHVFARFAECANRDTRHMQPRAVTCDKVKKTLQKSTEDLERDAWAQSFCWNAQQQHVRIICWYSLVHILYICAQLP
jgi:glutamate racemase